MSLITQNLSHRYPEMGQERPDVLRDIGFQLAGAEQLLLRGISGSGKTTLINIVAGLLTPTSGSVSLNGTQLYGLTESDRDKFRRETIGYVFQTHHLLPILNAWENVAMPLAFAGISTKDRKSKAIELLEQVGLGGLEGSRPSQLSTGQRQRVAIARALVHTPSLILADEPTASLDADNAENVINLLKTTCQAHNTTLIVASHDPTLAQSFNRIVDLTYGKWIENETKTEIAPEKINN